MKDFVEIQDRLITLENIQIVRKTEDLLIIEYYNPKSDIGVTKVAIDYSDILDDINDEKEIDKDYKKLKAALELKPENYEKYQDLFYKIYSLSFKRTFSFIRLRKIQDLILDFLK